MAELIILSETDKLRVYDLCDMELRINTNKK